MKNVRVGVIGTGWGQLQIEALRRVKNVEISAICDIESARATEAAKRASDAKIFTDYRELVSSDAADLISIVAPPEFHKAIAQSVIEAGKHIVCEKPLAVNALEASAMLEWAERKQIIHAVDFEMRFLPAFAYAKELIDEDYLGALQHANITMTLDRPWGEHGNWAADDARGGGLLMEVGSHFVDALRWLFGDVKAVLAQRHTFFPTIRVPLSEEPTKKNRGKDNGKFIRKIVTGDDAFWVVLQFARGGEAIMNFVSGARYDAGWSLNAYGQEGTLVVRSGQLLGARVGDREIGVLGIPKRLDVPDKPRDPMMWGMVRLFERVVSKIQGERESLPFPDFRDGLAVAKVTDAIRRASNEGAWVSVD